MISKEELEQWLSTLPAGTQIGVDEDGDTLATEEWLGGDGEVGQCLYMTKPDLDFSKLFEKPAI